MLQADFAALICPPNPRIPTSNTGSRTCQKQSHQANRDQNPEDTATAARYVEPLFADAPLASALKEDADPVLLSPNVRKDLKPCEQHPGHCAQQEQVHPIPSACGIILATDPVAAIEYDRQSQDRATPTDNSKPAVRLLRH